MWMVGLPVAKSAAVGRPVMLVGAFIAFCDSNTTGFQHSFSARPVFCGISGVAVTVKLNHTLFTEARKHVGQ